MLLKWEVFFEAISVVVLLLLGVENSLLICRTFFVHVYVGLTYVIFSVWVIVLLLLVFTVLNYRKHWWHRVVFSGKE